jgi:hypothetical protein
VKHKHGSRRQKRITALATQHSIPESTVIGRGLHRRRQPVHSSTARPLVFPEVKTLDILPCSDMGNGVMSSQSDALAALLASPIEELDLPVRPFALLKREGITSIGELLDWTAQRLIDDVLNFGPKCLEEVRRKLSVQTPPLYLKGDNAKIVAAALAKG